MMELPESRTIAQQLNKTVRGKQIKDVTVGHTPHGFTFFSMDKEQYPRLLNGRIITNSLSWSAQIEMQTDGGYNLALNDGINLRFLATAEARPEKHQLLIEFTDGAALVCSVQMYGGIMLFKEGEYNNPYYLVAKEKEAFNPLTDAFSEAYFMQIWQSVKANISIKALLATEQRIPGIGNGVIQDILFNAKVNPQSKIGSLNLQKMQQIFSSLKTTLAEMTAGGGRDTEKDLFGQNGQYQTVLSSKTWQKPCPLCFSPIIRKAYLGGNVYFCPTCQPL